MVRKRELRKGASLSVKLPTRKVREEFDIIYELAGCQIATNYLTKYYGVKRMSIKLDSRKVRALGRNILAYYCQNKAYFTVEGLNRQVLLHEFYHHLVAVKGISLANGKEEKEANSYAIKFLNS